MMHACASAAKLRGGGPILNCGIEAMAKRGTPPPRTVIASPSRPSGWERSHNLGRQHQRVPRSGGRTHPYTFGHDAVTRQTPERDQQLARQRHDQRLARRRSIRGSLPIPFGERTVLLEHEEPPRQLDHAAPHARVARAGQSLFTPFGPAFVGRAGETGPFPKIARVL